MKKKYQEAPLKGTDLLIGLAVISAGLIVFNSFVKLPDKEVEAPTHRRRRYEEKGKK